MLKAAQEYIAKGWTVFPLHTIVEGQCSCGKNPCSDAGKHPRLARGLKQASKDPAQIEEWFGPAAAPSNIAIVTGEISGITVVDIDIGPGKEGAESWAEAIREHGEPNTLMAETGSGGMHVLFHYNSALKTASNVLGKGVDCRNDGGYIVAAPSLHKSGGRYSWLNPDQAIAPLPAHLSRRKENRGRPRKDDPKRRKYNLEQVEDMLQHVPSEDRDTWRNVGIILGRTYGRTDEAFAVYEAWSEKAGGKKGRNHDGIMKEAFYDLSQADAGKQLTLGTIVHLAIENGWAPKTGNVPVEHFVFYGPGNNFIYRPTISFWLAAAVNAAVSPVNQEGQILAAADWLKEHQLATSMTCDPALEGDYIKGTDCHNGEMIEIPGAAVFNTYRKATIELGDARLASPFTDHVEKIFNKPGDATQFLNYMAHRVQKPWEKPRFALLLAGQQGTGKDTAVEFCCPAIGTWNVAPIEPAAFDSAFNEFCESTLVRISETANLHEMSKWTFNERTKVLIAGNPDIAIINPKYGQKHSVRMHCGVVLTTNHMASGIYIPPDDRRYDVMECATLEDAGLADPDARRNYFEDLWGWFFLEDGANHVAAYLTERDISKFSAANGQRKTAAHSTVVAGGMSSDEWLNDIIDELGEPQGIRSDWIMTRAVAAGQNDRDVRRKLANSISREGYTLFKNPSVKDGRWKISGKKVTVYVKEGTPTSFDPMKELQQEAF